MANIGFHRLKLSIRNLKHHLKQRFLQSSPFIPALVLIGVSLLLSYLNYSQGTWLTGWDNLHPEFDLSLNLKRSIFSVWQEYQSTGLLGGMAHAADLPRILILYMLSAISHLPSSNIRYLWTFFMLTIGPLGVYFSLKDQILHPLERKTIVNTFDKETKLFAAFLGGLFYILNLGTLQTFFLPFDSFVSFYGLIPWAIYFILKYLHQPNAKNLFYLTFVLFLTSPSFYVETTFIVFGLFIIPLLVTAKPKNSLKTSLVIFTTQAYWLLPVVFFVLTQSNVALEAKNNLINTPETFMRNLEFANLQSVSLIKGYWFKLLGYTNQNNFDYLLVTWRSHLNNPAVYLIGYFNFSLVITGIYYGLKKKLFFAKEFFFSLLICLFFLMGGVVEVGKSIPIIGELFRSPFTKFSLPLAYLYSIFYAIGTIVIMDLFSFLHHRFTYFLTAFSLSIGLVLFMTPAFTGNLISPQNRLKIPGEYFDLFAYMKTQDPALRIANFPQLTHWGWNYYSWGYQGSGFIWYGLNQPILDRAFDVWENTSQSYYEEISSALYSQDPIQFQKTIEKYKVGNIVIDKNILNVNNLSSTYTDELEQLLQEIPSITLEKNIGDKILIYRTNVDQTVKNFLSISNEQSSMSEQLFDLSLRPSNEINYNKNTFSLTQTLSAPINTQIHLPPYSQLENYLPVSIDIRKLSTGIEVSIQPLTPIITVNGHLVSTDAKPTVFEIPVSPPESSLVLGLNNQYYELQLPDELTQQSTFYPLVTTHLPSTKNIEISLFSDSRQTSYDLTSTFQNANPYQCQEQRPNRTLEKIVDRKSVTIIGEDINGCLSATLPTPANPNSLISFEFEYSSPTNLHGNVNLTDDNYYSTGLFQPLIAKKTPTFARVFSKYLYHSMKANLLLEAFDIKSLQEITYENIAVRYLPMIYSSTFRLSQTPGQTISLDKPTTTLDLQFPLIKSPFTVSVEPVNNLSSPIALNCDNLNNGTFEKKTDSNGFLYTSKNADSCDLVNLNQLPHDTNYVVATDYRFITGLPTTVCLENHATHNCDVFERLIDFNSIQSIINPISNPNETSGYSVHLFNQSFGNRPTQNLIKSITVFPFPLNFLKNITLSDSEKFEISNIKSQISNSSHPAEFLYTASITNDQPSTINLYQTHSPYWKVLEVSEADLKLPFWKLVAKLPFLYFQKPESRLQNQESNEWYNSWSVPSGDHHLVIFYLPQYLQFLGFALLPLPIFGLILYSIFRKLKKKT